MPVQPLPEAHSPVEMGVRMAIQSELYTGASLLLADSVFFSNK